jgi:4-amino-4-deoxy-L-arabinose transferase-like glycosyltransferase
MTLHRVVYYFFGAVILLCVVINGSTLHGGHNWGGDFSQYIIHAQNIIAQRPYGQGIMLNNPVVYPPGYPLLIAPFLKGFGLDFKILKMLNLFFWYAALYPLFWVAARRVRRDIALLLVLLFAASSSFFVFKQNILSDVPFFFFVSYAIYFFYAFCHRKGFERRQDVIHFILFLLVISWAFLLRSAGIVLFIAAAVYWAWVRKDVKKFLGVCLAFGAVLAVQTVWIGWHQGFFSHIWDHPLAFAGRIGQRNALVFQALFWFFCPGQTLLTESVFQPVAACLEWAAPLFYGLGAYFFCRQLWRREISFGFLFLGLYVALLLVWSGFESSVSGFVRYCYPIVGLFFVAVMHGLSSVCGRFFPAQAVERHRNFSVKILLVIFIFLNIFNIYGMYDFNDDVLWLRKNQELFQWVRHHLAKEEHYMIWRPRPVALMTGRVGTVPWREDLDRATPIFQRVHAMNISYVILSKHVDQMLIALFQDHPDFSDPVWENDSYVIFQVHRRVSRPTAKESMRGCA